MGKFADAIQERKGKKPVASGEKPSADKIDALADKAKSMKGADGKVSARGKEILRKTAFAQKG